MIQRGRKSAAKLAVIHGGGAAGQRPEPPEHLTDAQKEEWWAVVNRMPADWFPRETHAMLAQYCRHVARAGDIATVLDRMINSKKMDARVYEKLLRQEMAQSRAICTLATKMRLSQQSTYDKSKKKSFNEGSVSAPWEDDNSSDEHDAD